MSKNKKAAEPVPEPEPVAVEPVQPEIHKGTFTFVDGSKYEGEWIVHQGKQQRHGAGVYSNGGETYDGQWENDMMHGQGTHNFGSGAVYVGSFAGNAFNGHGKYTFADGSCYDGEWRANKMHGQGKYVNNATGATFAGKFVNGLYDSGTSYVNVRSL